MKTWFFKVLAILSFFVGSLEMMATQLEIPLTEDSTEVEHPREDPDTGRRSAPVPVYCTIDFDNNTVSGNFLLEEVTDYQIWDENGECCLVFVADAYTFVESLKYLPSANVYKIVLKTFNSSLVGYIDLE